MSDDPNTPGSQAPRWEDPASQPQRPSEPPAQQPAEPAPQQPPAQQQTPPPEPQAPPPQQPTEPPPSAPPPPVQPAPAAQDSYQSQPAAPPPPAVEPLPGPQPSVPFPLQQNEHVIKLVRRHWWFLWPWTAWLAIVALAPVAAAYWFLDLIGVADDLGWFFWIPALVWIGYWGFRAIFNWYRYQNDIWVITNQRLIDVFRSNPFNKRINTADLVNIQDLRVERRGITATILHYADLICSTAGTEGGTFIIGGAPHAEDLQLLIDKERDRERMRRV